MNEQIYTNYRLQLPTEEVVGTLVVRDGLIAEIQPNVTLIGQDGQGEYLMPGLIKLITRKTGNPLHETIKLATSNPARAVNILHDRGSLEVGKRADMITVYDDSIGPRLTSVIVQGRCVA